MGDRWQPLFGLFGFLALVFVALWWVRQKAHAMRNRRRALFAELAQRRGRHPQLLVVTAKQALHVRRVGLIESMPELEAFLELALPVADAFARHAEV